MDDAQTPNPSDEAAERNRAGALFSYLDSLGIETRTIWHPAVFTVEASSGVTGSIPGAHTKNLFLKDKKGRIFLVVALQETEVALKSLHQRIGGQGRLSFADAARMERLLGVYPGAVTAFGMMNDTGGEVRLVVDAALQDHEIINAHPLTNTGTTSISRGDLMRFFAATGHDPLIVDLTADDTGDSEEGSNP
ncbi:prolyl-tRNA synthetase associated domain-containing protein [Aureimonas altamirensis]|uniref:prolyl-tRNA synthetase associated domain-containing protein n=1 Tax=Aureimonas altamirensis TaxID=370622 RepID=UPI001E62F4A5|nr:prolyl-tRNA synthetase associated domain-containing protein [Aureimonas altamirensis]UHD45736.1 prolyl-tRNA synthetase associated domain-containing protein [Aureimonas altamirensis]